MAWNVVSSFSFRCLPVPTGRCSRLSQFSGLSRVVTFSTSVEFDSNWRRESCNNKIIKSREAVARDDNAVRDYIALCELEILSIHRIDNNGNWVIVLFFCFILLFVCSSTAAWVTIDSVRQYVFFLFSLLFAGWWIVSRCPLIRLCMPLDFALRNRTLAGYTK